MENIEKLKEKVAKDPSSKLFVPLAEEYRKAGKFDEAIKVLKEGIELQPEYMSARVSLGKIYLEKDMKLEAREEFEKVIRTIPDNLFAQRKLADIYRDLGEADRAIEQYKTVLKLNPLDEEAHSYLVELDGQSGSLVEEKADEATGEDAFAAVAEEFPAEEVVSEEATGEDAFAAVAEEFPVEEVVSEEAVAEEFLAAELVGEEAVEAVDELGEAVAEEFLAEELVGEEAVEAADEPVEAVAEEFLVEELKGDGEAEAVMDAFPVMDSSESGDIAGDIIEETRGAEIEADRGVKAESAETVEDMAETTEAEEALVEEFGVEEAAGVKKLEEFAAETVGEAEEVFTVDEADEEAPDPGRADSFVAGGDYQKAMAEYMALLSRDSGNRYVLQRVEELKTLLKLLGRENEILEVNLQSFLEGIKKQRDEFYGNS